MNNVHIIQYTWAGTWGPFTIHVECGECGLTEGIIRDVLKTEFADEPITFEAKEWLPNWWRILFRGGWHAPIVTINKRVIAQGGVIDRGLLAASIRKELTHVPEPTGTVIFSKEGCPHCVRAKELLDSKKIQYETRDVVVDPLAAKRMFTAAKRHIGNSTPVTLPQIWIEGKYIGSADDLEKHLKEKS